MQSRVWRYVLVSLVVGSGLIAGDARAATWVVDDNRDLPDDKPDCDCRTAFGSCTLRAAVMESNSCPTSPHVIDMKPDNYVLSISGVNENNPAIGDLDLTRDVAIVGNGSTIRWNDDTKEQARIFHVRAFPNTGDIFRFISMTIYAGLPASTDYRQSIVAGGPRMSGGAILAHDADLASGFTVQMIDVEVSQWGNETQGASNAVPYCGGGVAVDRGTIVAETTGSEPSLRETFHHLRSVSLGGGLCTAGTDVFGKGIQFNRNEAANSGGGAYILRGKVEIYDSSAGNNYAATFGGAFSTNADTIQFGSVVFHENKAPAGGGAILFAGADLSCDTCLFRENLGRAGGAVTFINHTGAAIVARSMFVKNTACQLSASRLCITDSLANGGALFMDGSSTTTSSLRLESTTFVDNAVAGNANGTFGFGGGLYASSAPFYAQNTTWVGNNAPGGGGGIYFRGYASQDRSVLESSTLTGGDSKSLGGGVHVSGSSEAPLLLRYSILFGNVSNSDCYSLSTSQLINETLETTFVGSLAGCAIGGQPTVQDDPQLVGSGTFGGPTYADPIGTQRFITVPAMKAIDASGLCEARDTGVTVPRDARGVVRPLGGRCDSGAYEVIRISAGNRSVTEPNSGSVVASFPLSADGAFPPDASVSIGYSTANLTALAGSDYTAVASGTATMTSASGSFGVSVLGDTIYEGNETFRVNLSLPVTSGYLLDTSSVTGTIVDNDPAPSFTVAWAPASQNEGTGSGPAYVATITKTGATATTASVNYTVAPSGANPATAGASCAAGVDYAIAAPTGTLSFTTAITTRTVTVTSCADTWFEPNETFSITLSSPVNAQLGSPSSAIATLLNDDATPTVTLSSPAQNEGISLVFTASLSNPSGATITIPFTTVDVTARSDTTIGLTRDFVAQAGNISFAPGATTATVTVATHADTYYESTEIMRLQLSAATAGTVTLGAPNPQTGTIMNDDPLPVLAIAPTGPVSVAEETPGAQVPFTASINTLSAFPCSFTITAADITATRTVDYNFTNGPSVIPSGNTSATFVATINDDAIYELNETFNVGLSSATNCSIGGATSGTVTITNAETTPPVIEMQAATASVNENGATVALVVRSSVAAASPITINYSRGGGTATGALSPGAGIDYQNGTGVVMLPAGSTTVVINVPIYDDSVDEFDETFNVTLTSVSGVTGASVGANAVTAVTILDNDLPPAVTISSLSVAEGDSGNTTAQVNFTLIGNATDKTVGFSYRTVDGTALASNNDYVAVAATPVTMSPGTTVLSVNFTVRGDRNDEADETFQVAIVAGSQSNVTLTGNGTVTILADDAEVNFAATTVAVTEPDVGTAPLTYRLVRSRNLASIASTVAIARAAGSTADAPASAFADYQAFPATVTIPAGATQVDFTVNVLGDTRPEPNELLFLTISEAVPGTGASIGSNATHFGTINEDVDANPALTLSVPAAVLESAAGPTGTTTVTFTASLAFDSGFTVTANYSTVDGTARSTAPADFNATSGTLSFAPGETTKTVVVTVRGDTRNETNETFSLSVSSITNTTNTTATATTSITDDDPDPVLSVADISVAEPDGTSTLATFTLVLSAATEVTPTVTVATGGAGAGFATAGADYTALAPVAVSFNAAELAAGQKTVTVSVLPDALDEADEIFQLNLSGALNCSIPDAQAIATITDHPGDTPPALQLTGGTAVESAGTLTFFLSLAQPSGRDVTASVTTANGTATAGSDYTAIAPAQLITFPAGVTGPTAIPVTILNDAIAETTNETFTMTATSALNGSPSATGTITDDDGTPTLSINSPSVNEGGNLVFTVTLAPVSASDVTFGVAVAGVTAGAGDFTYSGAASRTIPAGQSTLTITVATNDDALDEADETVELRLTGHGSPASLGTILDNDATPTVSVSGGSATEGATVSFTVSLSAASGRAVSVQWAAQLATVGNIASASDFASTAAGTINFAAGETTRSFTVATTNDTLNELDEVFAVVLTAPTNATLGTSTATGTIVDNDPVPTVSITGGTITEGNSGTTPLNFTVSLSAASGRDVSVFVTATAGTASVADFSFTNQTVTIPAGSTSVVVPVAVIGDTNDENDEQFTLTMSAPANANLSATPSAIGTITDDDAEPSVSIGNAAGTEVAGTMVFTLSLSAASGKTVTVVATTSNGTALAGDDYTASSQTVTFAPGQTSRPFSVSILNDVFDEDDETVNVTLTAPTNATLDDALGVGVISDGPSATDDPPPRVVVDDVSVSEAAGAVSVTVRLLAPTTLTPLASGRALTLSPTATAGTALLTSDYLAPQASVAIPAGTTSVSYTIPIVNDALHEATETFTTSIGAPANLTVLDGTATVTITDDDAAPSLSINDVSLNEGNSGNTPFVFTVSLSALSGAPVNVSYATANGTATAPSDFTAASGSLTIPAGSSSATVTVLVAGDALFEGNETFAVNLTAPSGATLSDASGTGTILEDDGAPSLSISDASASESAAQLSFTITLAPAAGTAVSVTATTSNGTATAGADFMSVSGPFTFAAGETTKTFLVPLLNDSLDELDETLTVTLTGATNAALSDATAVGTIVDDDAAPSVSIADTSAQEDSGVMTFTLSLSAASALPVTVPYVTVDGTAFSGSDFVAVSSGSAVIPAGATSTTVAVSLVADLVYEGPQVFTVQLGTPTNATLGDSSGTGTIVDDEALPVVSVANDTFAEGDVAHDVQVRFEVSVVSEAALSFDYAFADGTALAGSDYVAGAGTAVIPAGAASTTAPLSLLADVFAEPLETVLVVLSNPAFGSVAADQLVTISDDDSPAPLITDVSPPEGPYTGGTVIVITGSGFTTESTVSIGGLPASVVFVDATTLQVTVPAMAAPGAQDILVLNGDGQSSTLGDGFFATGSDIEVTLECPDTMLFAGVRLECAIVVRNDGPSNASGVTVTYSLPNGLRFVGTEFSGCAAQGAQIMCSIGDVADRESVTIGVTIMASVAGTLTHEAGASQAGADPNAANDNTSMELFINPSADMAARIVREFNVVNGLVSIPVSLDALGPSDAPASTLMLALSGDAELVSLEGGSCDLARAECALGDLGSPERKTVTATLRVLADGPIVLEARALSSRFDPFADNDEDILATTGGELLGASIGTGEMGVDEENNAELFTRSRQAGCACSADGAPSFDGALVALALLMVLRRVRGTRRGR